MQHNRVEAPITDHLGKFYARYGEVQGGVGFSCGGR